MSKANRLDCLATNREGRTGAAQPSLRETRSVGSKPRTEVWRAVVQGTGGTARFLGGEGKGQIPDGPRDVKPCVGLLWARRTAGERCPKLAPPVGRLRRSPAGYRFDQDHLGRAVLGKIPVRSISVRGAPQTDGGLDDKRPLIKATGRRFIVRALCLWGGGGQPAQELEKGEGGTAYRSCTGPKPGHGGPGLASSKIVTPEWSRFPVPGVGVQALGMPAGSLTQVREHALSGTGEAGK